MTSSAVASITIRVMFFSLSFRANSPRRLVTRNSPLWASDLRDLCPRPAEPIATPSRSSPGGLDRSIDRAASAPCGRIEAGPDLISRSRQDRDVSAIAYSDDGIPCPSRARHRVGSDGPEPPLPLPSVSSADGAVGGASAAPLPSLEDCQSLGGVQSGPYFSLKIASRIRSCCVGCCWV
jgi:hypothetical protein